MGKELWLPPLFIASLLMENTNFLQCVRRLAVETSRTWLVCSPRAHSFYSSSVCKVFMPCCHWDLVRSLICKWTMPSSFPISPLHPYSSMMHWPYRYTSSQRYESHHYKMWFLHMTACCTRRWKYLPWISSIFFRKKIFLMKWFFYQISQFHYIILSGF
jgi:hypothetical protein